MWREALQGNRFLARFPVPCLGLQGRLGLCRCTSTCAVPQAYAAPPLECIRGFGYAYGPRQSLRSLLHPWAAAVAFVGFTPCFACCAGLRRDLIGHVNVGLTQNGAWRAPLHPNVCVSFIAVILREHLHEAPRTFICLSSRPRFHVYSVQFLEGTSQSGTCRFCLVWSVYSISRISSMLQGRERRAREFCWQRGFAVARS